MIRTLIEVQGEDTWDYEKKLHAALDKLGFEPKPGADHVRWMSDVWAALQENKIDVQALVKGYRAKRDAFTQ